MGATDSAPPARLSWEKQKLIENLNEGIDIADVNRDGQPDVISGPHWFEGLSWKQHPVREIGIGNE
jgi:hypothetical protein